MGSALPGWLEAIAISGNSIAKILMVINVHKYGATISSTPQTREYGSTITGINLLSSTTI